MTSWSHDTGRTKFLVICGGERVEGGLSPDLVLDREVQKPLTRLGEAGEVTEELILNTVQVEVLNKGRFYDIVSSLHVANTKTSQI